MADDVYNLAIVRIRALRHELERLESFARTYEELAAGESERQPPVDARQAQVPVSALSPAMSVEPASRGQDRIASTEEIERIATRVLLEIGHPLKRQALFARVKATGVVIGGANELGNFGSKISRSEKLKNIPGRGYWPIDAPVGEPSPENHQ